MTKTGDIVCFGEILLRLNPPNNERFSQTRQFNVFVGGAEANVAIALAQLGQNVRMVSCLENNPLSVLAKRHIGSFGVDLTSVESVKGRTGLYFAETGATVRSSLIHYDRADTAFTRMTVDTLDWRAILEGASVLHLSGITPATGQGPSASALKAVKFASDMGVRVSFDGNYREGLWRSWAGDGPAILDQLLQGATFAFINERDIQLILGEQNLDRPTAVKMAFSRYDKLQYIACTTRSVSNVADMSLGANLFTRHESFTVPPVHLENVVERIGGGDAFAAGFLHAHIEGYDDEKALSFALSTSALKHSVPGDQFIGNESEVWEHLAGGSMDVKR